MDFGMDGVALNIASSTSGYIVTFAPIFLLIGGIVLGLAVIERILDHFFPQKLDSQSE